MKKASKIKQPNAPRPCRNEPISAVVGIDLGDRRSTYQEDPQHPEAQTKAMTGRDRIADDFARKMIAGVRRRSFFIASEFHLSRGS